MGEIADMMLDGVVCEQCGDYLGEGDGFPRLCSGCQPGRRSTPRAPVFKCMSDGYDAFAKERRWLEAAARGQGVNPDDAPAYLAKLAKRKFVKLVDNLEDRAYFITDLGRWELTRIAKREGT